MARLGPFNLSMSGHGEAVRLIKSFGVPLLVTGGGSYTNQNVTRCWAYETAILAGVELDNQLPATDYWGYFKPSNFTLDVKAQKCMDNCNLSLVSRIVYRWARNMLFVGG